MKGQGKIPQDQINEEEIGNLPEKEFRLMIVKMIQDLGKRMEARIEKIQEILNKDLEELKNKQSAMNNTITEMKNTLEGNKKILGINLSKEVKDLYTENYKILIKETEGTSKQKDIPCPSIVRILLKFPYYPMKYTDSMQSLSKFQCNFSQKQNKQF